MVDIDASAASATTVTLSVVLAAGAIIGSAQKLLVSARAFPILTLPYPSQRTLLRQR